MHSDSVFVGSDLLKKTHDALVNKTHPKPKPNFRRLTRQLERANDVRNKLRKTLPISFPQFLQVLRKTAALKKEITKYRIEHDFWALSKEICNGSADNRVECTLTSAFKHFEKTYALISDPRPTPIPLTPDPDEFFECPICNIEIKNMTQHLKTKKHQEKDDGRFIDETLYCSFCDCRVKQMTPHLKTKKHLENAASHMPHPITDPISINDIEKALRDSNLNSSPGLDRIRYTDLTNNPLCFPLLCELYNKVLQTGYPLESDTGWSSAIITLIYKNKGTRKDVKNYRPIAVTSSITRLFHKILASRLEVHLRSSSFFDESVQKGFLKGLHGTLDHPFVLQECMDEMMHTGANAFITLFDLRDAFGSVPHQLIKQTLLECELPLKFVNYIIRYYNQTEASIKIAWKSSNTFPIKQGIMQGDPLSPLIFSACFNSAIKAMSSASQEFRCGNAPSFLCYADDTALITNSAENHQNLTNLFHAKTREIGLTIRPDKCISWCVSNKKIGTFTVKIGEDNSRSLTTKPEKYLGVLHSIDGKEEVSKLFLKEFRLKCNRIINYRHITKSDKAKIFQLYLLPSQYFSFMTHELSPGTLVKLNALQEKFLIDQSVIPIDEIYHNLQTRSYIFKLFSKDPLVSNAVIRKQAREIDNKDINSAALIASETSSLQEAKNLFRKLFKFYPNIIEEYPDNV